MRYALDLSSLSLNDYREWLLKRQNRPPGRIRLWDNINPYFIAIERQGIDDVAALKKRLSTFEKRAELAAATGIPEDDLILLKREISSLEPKPVLIADFPGISSALVSDLRNRGITRSKAYFESTAPGTDELFCLCDLVRINGVGTVAAKAFYDAGYRSVAVVACADANVMFGKVSKVNEAKGYYKAKLGAADMQFCIDFAVILMKHSG